MLARHALVLSLCFIATTSCAQRNRISRHALDRLAKNNDRFVLVFGSLSTPKGTLARPTIRFVHQTERTDPESLLCSLVISSGERFYAVLQNPPGMAFVDTFYAEIGSANTAFDKVTFARLREGDAPLALYFGEMQVVPAKERAVQGQTVVVSTRDDFESAERELKRRYPGFAGTIRRAGFLRTPSPGPVQPTPERAR